MRPPVPPIVLGCDHEAHLRNASCTCIPNFGEIRQPGADLLWFNRFNMVSFAILNLVRSRFDHLEASGSQFSIHKLHLVQQCGGDMPRRRLSFNSRYSDDRELDSMNLQSTCRLAYQILAKLDNPRLSYCHLTILNTGTACHLVFARSRFWPFSSLWDPMYQILCRYLVLDLWPRNAQTQNFIMLAHSISSSGSDQETTSEEPQYIQASVFRKVGQCMAELLQFDKMATVWTRPWHSKRKWVTTDLCSIIHSINWHHCWWPCMHSIVISMFSGWVFTKVFVILMFKVISGHSESK